MTDTDPASVDPDAVPANPVVNIDDVPEEVMLEGEHWGHAYKVLTPSMEARGGNLGVNCTRLPPGRVAGPFHYHQLDDEVFYVLSGRGTLRYGEQLIELRAGDCISCPARTGVAHQIANTSDADLVYLAIGRNDRDEVCVYPDSGKIYVRSLRTIGTMERQEYMHGEPDRPRVLDLIAARDAAESGSSPGTTQTDAESDGGKRG